MDIFDTPYIRSLEAKQKRDREWFTNAGQKLVDSFGFAFPLGSVKIQTPQHFIDAMRRKEAWADAWDATKLCGEWVLTDWDGIAYQFASSAMYDGALIYPIELLHYVAYRVLLTPLQINAIRANLGLWHDNEATYRTIGCAVHDLAYPQEYATAAYRVRQALLEITQPTRVVETFKWHGLKKSRTVSLAHAMKEGRL